MKSTQKRLEVAHDTARVPRQRNDVVMGCIFSKVLRLVAPSRAFEQVNCRHRSHHHLQISLDKRFSWCRVQPMDTSKDKTIKHSLNTQYDLYETTINLNFLIFTVSDKLPYQPLCPPPPPRAPSRRV
jgi:hypothetical protein